MKEEFNNAKLTLNAEFKRELDERNIVGIGFLKIKTLVKYGMILRVWYCRILLAA